MTSGLLRARTTDELLARIVPDDPLGIRARAALAVRERALFLDLDAVVVRTFALLARDVAAIGEDVEPFLDRCVRRAIDSLLREEVDALLDEARDDEPGPSRAFASLARSLDLSPVAMRTACARFHALDRTIREAFFDVVLDGVTPDHLGEEARAVAARARFALDVLRHAASAVSPPAPRATP